ncbi:hypothetical protein F4778DRAFT_778647 [Xylariomycetidae sp. FL2044]|nr:hypothetical protein F4778DRAFT_778647 [Xylariomycetidae sp. FL2044]
MAQPPFFYFANAMTRSTNQHRPGMEYPGGQESPREDFLREPSMTGYMAHGINHVYKGVWTPNASPEDSQAGVSSPVHVGPLTGNQDIEAEGEGIQGALESSITAPPGLQLKTHLDDGSTPFDGSLDNKTSGHISSVPQPNTDVLDIDTPSSSDEEGVMTPVEDSDSEESHPEREMHDEKECTASAQEVLKLRGGGTAEEDRVRPQSGPVSGYPDTSNGRQSSTQGRSAMGPSTPTLTGSEPSPFENTWTKSDAIATESQAAEDWSSPASPSSSSSFYSTSTTDDLEEEEPFDESIFVNPSSLSRPLRRADVPVYAEDWTPQQWQAQIYRNSNSNSSSSNYTSHPSTQYPDPRSPPSTLNPLSLHPSSSYDPHPHHYSSPYSHSVSHSQPHPLLLPQWYIPHEHRLPPSPPRPPPPPPPPPRRSAAPPSLPIPRTEPNNSDLDSVNLTWEGGDIVYFSSSSSSDDDDDHDDEEVETEVGVGVEEEDEEEEEEEEDWDWERERYSPLDRLPDEVLLGYRGPMTGIGRGVAGAATLLHGRNADAMGAPDIKSGCLWGADQQKKIRRRNGKEDPDMDIGEFDG